MFTRYSETSFWAFFLLLHNSWWNGLHTRVPLDSTGLNSLKEMLQSSRFIVGVLSHIAPAMATLLQSPPPSRPASSSSSLLCPLKLGKKKTPASLDLASCHGRVVKPSSHVGCCQNGIITSLTGPLYLLLLLCRPSVPAATAHRSPPPPPPSCHPHYLAGLAPRAPFLLSPPELGKKRAPEDREDADRWCRPVGGRSIGKRYVRELDSKNTLDSILDRGTHAHAIDGNRYKIFTYPWIPNSVGTDTGLSLCPWARAWLQLLTQRISCNGFEMIPKTTNMLTYGPKYYIYNVSMVLPHFSWSLSSHPGRHHTQLPPHPTSALLLGPMCSANAAPPTHTPAGCRSPPRRQCPGHIFFRPV